MRDDRLRWNAAWGDNLPSLSTKHCTAKILPLQRQIMLSGEISTCLRLSGIDGEPVDGRSFASGDTYAIRLRRDRILAINCADVSAGWNDDAGVAVSDMTSGYGVIELNGSDAIRILATGTEFPPAIPSRSVAHLWHGYDCFLYRYGEEHCYRLHARAGHLQALWEMVDRQMDLIADLPEMV